MKTYLTKYNIDNRLSEYDLIKYESSDSHFPKCLKLDDVYNTNLYYKVRENKTPKWYSQYLNKNDQKN